jgi:hypothetical protein
MKPLLLVCVLSLLLFSFEESAARASPEKMGVPAQGVSQDAPGAQGTAVEVLRGFQTYYLEIDTIFLEHPAIEQALAKRSEFQAWGLTRTTEPGVADVIIQFTLPALTWQWNYKLIHGSTGQLLGFGRVAALEEHEASHSWPPTLSRPFESHVALRRYRGRELFRLESRQTGPRSGM